MPLGVEVELQPQRLAQEPGQIQQTQKPGDGKIPAPLPPGAGEVLTAEEDLRENQPGLAPARAVPRLLDPGEKEPFVFHE